MKVNIKVNVGRGSDPEPTIAHYVRARWGKNKVTLTGIASCQGRTWNMSYTYFFKKFGKETKEQILQNLFEGESVSIPYR